MVRVVYGYFCVSLFCCQRYGAFLPEATSARRYFRSTVKMASPPMQISVDGTTLAIQELVQSLFPMAKQGHAIQL